jgi:hypothetical protein
MRRRLRLELCTTFVFTLLALTRLIAAHFSVYDDVTPLQIILTVRSMHIRNTVSPGQTRLFPLYPPKSYYTALLYAAYIHLLTLGR